MSSPAHATQNSPETFARWRRRDHANIEAMQNLIIAGIAERTGIEMPTNARSFISALQGAHGGGIVPFEEFERGLVNIGKQLQFTGNDEAIRARAGRWKKELNNYQKRTGFELITILDGGKIKGHAPNGAPIREAGRFIDNIKPFADDAVQRARRTELWKANPSKAMAAQVAAALDALPRLPVASEDEANKPASVLSLTEYMQRAENRIIKFADHAAEEIESQGDDGAEWMKRVARELMKRAESIETTHGARRDKNEFDVFTRPYHEAGLDDARELPNVVTLARALVSHHEAGIDDARESATTSNTCNKFAPDAEPHEAAPSIQTAPALVPVAVPALLSDEAAPDAPLCNKNVTQLAAQESEAQEFTEPDNRKLATDSPAVALVEWALWWARRGVPVFPVHTVRDGVCSCECSEVKGGARLAPKCKGGHVCGRNCTSKGKHPRTRDGHEAATTDEGTIREWWQKWPDANIGGATGARSRFHVIDVDPKNGGDESLAALVETHGDEWLETLYIKTGSRGCHFFYIQPDELHLNSTAGRIAKGIDSRGTGGYVVLPPSLHASGARYEIKTSRAPRALPAWLVEALTAKVERGSQNVLTFKGKGTGTSAGAQFFGDGERNQGLFAVGIGRWRHGYAEDAIELCAQLIEINRRRCVPPLHDAEVTKMAANIERNYAHLRGIDKGKGGAVDE
jgi:hypothetical protein